MMSEPIMIKAKGNGIKIQLALWEGKGKQILCIHGLTANCRCWEIIASALSSPSQGHCHGPSREGTFR